jgi:hypothetical protein
VRLAVEELEEDEEKEEIEGGHVEALTLQVEKNI